MIFRLYSRSEPHLAARVFLLLVCLKSQSFARETSTPNQQDISGYDERSGTPEAQTSSWRLQKGHRCSRQSFILARQTLVHELNLMNNFNSIWFDELDRDELIEEQKQSLGNIIMSGASQQLLNNDGQPIFEIESSYFRSLNINQLPAPLLNNGARSAGNTVLPLQQQQHQHQQQQQQQQQHPGTTTTAQTNQAISVKLMHHRSLQDKCYLSGDKSHFTYVIGLSIGPIEHHLDVVYNLPKELRLSQPSGWKYAQIRLIVPQMNYEVTLKQSADYKLQSTRATATAAPAAPPTSGGRNSGACPLEVSDVTYLNSIATPISTSTTSTARNASTPSASSGVNPAQLTVFANGLAATNQTILYLERLFNDYTRPTISSRLRQALKFYLNTKTLPLSTV